MKITDAPTAWMPNYETQIGDQNVMVEIPELSQTECPISMITPEAQALVNEVMRAEAVYERTGATLFGPDTAKWHTRWYDTVKLVQSEEWRVDNAIEEMRRRMGK